MKFKVERESLLSGLSKIVGVAEKRTTVPALSCVCITAEQDKLSMEATDSDITMRTMVDADVADSGSWLFVATQLADIVRKLPSGAIADFSVDNENKTAVIKSGRSRFTVPVLPFDHFPRTTDSISRMMDVKAKDLHDALSTVQFAISSEETRYYLCGVYLHPISGGSGLTSVATDGYCLAVSCGCGGIGGFDPVIIPSKTVGVILKLLASGKCETVQIGFSDRQVKVVAENDMIVSKLIDGKYPDYERIMPRDPVTKVNVSVAELKAAVSRVLTVASKGGSTIVCDFNGDELTVTARGEGEASEIISISSEGPPIKIGYNGKYLLDILANSNSNDVELRIIDYGSPTLFIPHGSSEKFVLTPVRV